jgi:hypothetical protein
MENATEEQILKIQEILNELDLANNSITSDCSIEQLKLYQDNVNNIYLSYICRLTGATRSVDKFFIKIDKTGKKEFLNEKSEEDELEKLFKTFKHIQ